MRPIYSTRAGKAYQGDALGVLSRMRAQSISLVFTSPPFALRRQKAYGNLAGEEYIHWFLPIADQVHRVLRADGSFVMELGGAWNPGGTRSLLPYQLLLELCSLFHLAQDFYWYNPKRLPGPAEWVTIRRTRVKEATTMIWWLSKCSEPQADNRQVLRDYARPVAERRERRNPSGHWTRPDTWKNNGGAIPPNLLTVAGVGRDEYSQRCRAAGVQVHPCRMPRELPEFFIRLLTRPGQTVLDPFAGSNTTGRVAEDLGRRWIAIEKDAGYVAGSKLRFSGA